MALKRQPGSLYGIKKQGAREGGPAPCCGQVLRGSRNYHLLYCGLDLGSFRVSDEKYSRPNAVLFFCREKCRVVPGIGWHHAPTVFSGRTPRWFTGVNHLRVLRDMLNRVWVRAVQSGVAHQSLHMIVRLCQSGRKQMMANQGFELRTNRL